MAEAVFDLINPIVIFYSSLRRVYISSDEDIEFNFFYVVETKIKQDTQISKLQQRRG